MSVMPLLFSHENGCSFDGQLFSGFEGVNELQMDLESSLGRSWCSALPAWGEL